jgi:Vitamin K-dependent gamma-carboxylase
MRLFSKSAYSSIAPLITFRIIFGSLAFIGTLRFLLKGWVNDLYIEPQFFFGFLGFEWVKPLPGFWMYLPFLLMLVGSLGIILGLFYRFSTILFFLSFTYVELLDKTNYLNHYYFVSLIAFLMIWLPANRNFSLDVHWRKFDRWSITRKFHLQILKFQIACVYFFAGLAKINPDWLFEAEPLFTWLQSHRDMPIFGTLFAEKWVAYAFSWFGCFYDLFIVFFLLMTRTRLIAYFFVVVFHLMTSWLFPIGVFPMVMIGCTLIFFSENFHEKIIVFFQKGAFSVEKKSFVSKFIENRNIWLHRFFIVFIVFQLLLPMRYLLYPGSLFWTEEGFRFSWRVMLMHKEGNAQFYIKDQKTGGEIEVPNDEFLTKRQIDHMSTQPDMIIQFAHLLKEKFQDSVLIINEKAYRIHQPTVHADVYVALNGRPSQLMISKSVNLTAKKYDLRNRSWLEKFKDR